MINTSQAAVSGRAASRTSCKGLTVFVLDLFLFACLAASYIIPVIIAVRYFVHYLLMIAVLAPRNGRQLVKAIRTGLTIARAISLMVGSLFYGLALQRMPVAEKTANNFLALTLVVLVVRPVLGERIGALWWPAAATSFHGVLMISRQGGNLDSTGIKVLTLPLKFWRLHRHGPG